MPHDEKTARVVDEQAESQHTLIPGRNGAPLATRATDIPTLRYRHRALWILAIYVPLLVVPWTLTCLLAYHPVGLPSYIQTDFSESDLSTQRRIVNALAVLNSIASIVTIPIISALIAQAAVVYTQRRRKNQSVSVRQTFALADAGWSNPTILFEAWPPWKTHAAGNATQSGWSGPGSGFLWLAAVFLLLCSILQPVREGLVVTERMLVMTTKDDPAGPASRYGFGRRYVPLGYDPEPADMATIPEGVAVQQLEKSLVSLSPGEVPTHLWPDLENGVPFALRDFQFTKQLGPWQQPDTGYFAAALPNGTTTGVLRQRAMRLNSTVRCTQIEKAVFPVTCEGQNPFTASFFNSTEQLHVRICVPGQRGKFPWRLSRSRQDISEDIFVDVDTTDKDKTPVSYTQHCTVNTTRGYFELGNYRNDYVPGALLNEWVEPDPFAKRGEFNDYLSEFWRDGNALDIDGNGTKLVDIDGRWRRPSNEDKLTDIPGWPVSSYAPSDWSLSPAFRKMNMTMAGPLMTSAVTLFGETSLIAAANASTNETRPLVLDRICQENRLPFSAFRSYRDYAVACEAQVDDKERLHQIMRNFTNVLFSDTFTTGRYISASVFHANEALLVQTARKTARYTARPFFAAPGTFIPKPAMSLASTIFISILMLLQLLGLAYLVWYIYQVPTWTGMLDALAIARITNSLDRGDIPALGSVTARDFQRLQVIDALVGVVERNGEGCSSGSETVTEGKTVELGLGASGLFSRKLTKFRVQRSAGIELDCQCEGCRRRRNQAHSITSESSWR